MNSAESAGTIDADALGMGAEMATAGQTVAAPSADDMTFAADEFACMKISDVGPGRDDLSHELMADRHGHRNGGLRPVVPLIDM